MVQGILALIVLYVLSILMLFKPDFLWKIEFFLNVKKGEPTDWYLTKMRLGGFFFLLFSICFTIYLIFSS